MSEITLASIIERLGDEAVACSGYDKVGYAIEFTRRVDQMFPVGHPDRFNAVQLAVPAGYLAGDWVLVEA
jgi:hypothetical protein